MSCCVSFCEEFVQLTFCKFSHPAASQVRETIVVPVIPPRDAPVDLHLQVFVGLKSRYNVNLFFWKSLVLIP
jgi:hypothetical protein